MKVICVDDELLVLQLTTSLCRNMPEVDSADGFTSALDALKYIDRIKPDVALLDIDMPDMNGVDLAREIMSRSPGTAIIFVTGYSEFAVEAFSIHASGYILKPVNREQLYREIRHAMTFRSNPEPVLASVKTFGNFDITVAGEPVRFQRLKAKEILAYLVDKRGSSVTRGEIFSALWEDGEYDRSMQKQLDVIIRSLRSTLQAYEIDEIFEMKGGAMRIIPGKIDCDAYHYLDGEPEAVKSYRGEYMSSYSWASLSRHDTEQEERGES